MSAFYFTSPGLLAIFNLLVVYVWAIVIVLFPSILAAHPSDYVTAMSF